MLLTGKLGREGELKYLVEDPRKSLNREVKEATLTVGGGVSCPWSTAVIFENILYSCSVHLSIHICTTSSNLLTYTSVYSNVYINTHTHHFKFEV